MRFSFKSHPSNSFDAERWGFYAIYAFKSDRFVKNPIH